MGCADLPGVPIGADDAAIDGGGSDASGSDVVEAPLDLVGRNDVSILWPIEGSGTNLLRPSSEGEHGPLLDALAYAEVPPLVRGAMAPLDSLRVVAMRLDPCFPGPAGCVAMVRLVIQPLAVGRPGFEDAAVHLHYPLPAEELEELLREIVRARQDAGALADLPLGVHPVLASEGVDGAFGDALEAAILRRVGVERLDRVTFTTRAGARAATWEWGRIDRSLAGFRRVAMPAAGTDAAGLQVLTGDDLRDYVVTPASPTAGALARAYVIDERLGDVAIPDQRAVLSRITDVLHPERADPDSVDCASCHIAPHLYRSAVAAWPEVEPTQPAFVPSAAPALLPPASRDRIRAFGYFDAEPQVNDRTVHETEVVMDYFRGEH